MVKNKTLNLKTITIKTKKTKTTLEARCQILLKLLLAAASCCCWLLIVRLPRGLREDTVVICCWSFSEFLPKLLMEQSRAVCATEKSKQCNYFDVKKKKTIKKNPSHCSLASSSSPFFSLLLGVAGSISCFFVVVVFLITTKELIPLGGDLMTIWKWLAWQNGGVGFHTSYYCRISKKAIWVCLSSSSLKWQISF